MKTKFIRLLTNDVDALTNIMALTISSIVFVSCNTTNQTHLQNTISHKLNDSLLLDRDGNRYSIKIFTENNIWMTTNLKLNIPDSYCYENAEENCEKYGRLYTWQSAQKGCSLLGGGWRLSTAHEWRQLSISYGGIAEDSNINRKGAYKALLYAGTSGFNAVLGGGRGMHASMPMDSIGLNRKQ